jgi:hypothetical protein
MFQSPRVDADAAFSSSHRGRLRHRHSSMVQYRTGTTGMVMISMAIPPKEGMAIGTMISDPRPVAVNTGISARTAVAVVVRPGPNPTLAGGDPPVADEVPLVARRQRLVGRTAAAGARAVL